MTVSLRVCLNGCDSAEALLRNSTIKDMNISPRCRWQSAFLKAFSSSMPLLLCRLTVLAIDSSLHRPVIQIFRAMYICVHVLEVHQRKQSSQMYILNHLLV